MVARLDFGLLKPVDIGAAVSSFDAGRQRRDSRIGLEQEQQLAAQKLQQQQAEIDREQQANEAAAGYFESLAGGSAPSPAMTSPVAATGPSPAMVADAPEAPNMAAMPPPEAGEMVVTASRDTAPHPMSFLANMARAGQGEMAMKLWEASRTVDKDRREQTIASYDAIAATAQTLAGLPYEQRRAALVNMAPALAARGVPLDMIEGFDPTDEAIQAATSQALGIKGVFEVQDKAADNAREESRIDRQLAVTMRGQDMTDARQRQSNNIAAGGVSNTIRRTEGDLRKEFNALPDVKGFREVSTSYRQIRASASKPNPTAADDISTIFSYMKMLDPGSVVREGEFATAQNSGGIPDTVRNAYNRALDGTRLNQEQRTNFVESAAGIVLSRADRFNKIANEYRGYAADYGGSPDRIAKPVATTAPQGGGRAATPRVTSDAEWERLPKGTVYLDPNGKRRTKQ